MRSIPPYSTDLLYKEGGYKEEDLIALGNALGVGNINVITTTTLTPERLLYHACLTAIQTYVKFTYIAEADRAKEIADLADRLYADVKEPYLEKIAQTKDKMLEKEQAVTDFSLNLDKVERDIPWNAQRFTNSWDTEPYSKRSEKKAIETYRIIRTRVENGEYALRPDETIGDLVAKWGRMNVHYKHYRDVARSLIDEHIHQTFPSEQLLTMHHTSERHMTMFLGAMGSGKSEMSNYFIKQLPEATRNDLALHNADCLKFALYRSAKKEKEILADHCYKGEEIQAESSNALYEATRKRGYLARQKFHAPDVVLNSIVLGSFEVQEGIAGGGHVIAHHINMPYNEAVEEANKRALTDMRAPSPEDIQWSTRASARSLLLLTDPSYKNINLTVHLYERHAGKAPQHYGSIDAAKGILYVHDLNALSELSQTMFGKKSKRESLEILLSEYTKAGFTIAFVQEASLDAIATLDTHKNLIIEQSHPWNEQHELRDAFMNVATNRKIGKMPLITGFSKQEGILHVGR